MNENPQPPMMGATVSLTVRGKRLDLRMSIPEGKVGAPAMLPLFRKVAEDLLDAGVAQAEAAGKKVSCKKGCGACCRQLVPISLMEAREICRVVERMDEQRRAVVLKRFESARQRLAEADMLGPLSQPDQFSNEHMRALGREYFELGIACPFLEAESCSIYHDRPITCREYLVTSPAENCSRPSPENIGMVDLPAGPVWTAVARFEKSANGRMRWVPLILALDSASISDGEPQERPGKQWAQELIGRLASREKK